MTDQTPKYNVVDDRHNIYNLPTEGLSTQHEIEVLEIIVHIMQERTHDYYLSGLFTPELVTFFGNTMAKDGNLNIARYVQTIEKELAAATNEIERLKQNLRNEAAARNVIYAESKDRIANLYMLPESMTGSEEIKSLDALIVAIKATEDSRTIPLKLESMLNYALLYWFKARVEKGESCDIVALVSDLESRNKEMGGKLQELIINETAHARTLDNATSQRDSYQRSYKETLAKLKTAEDRIQDLEIKDIGNIEERQRLELTISEERQRLELTIIKLKAQLWDMSQKLPF